MRTSDVAFGLIKKTGPSATEIATVGSTVRVSTPKHLVEFGLEGFAFTPRDERGILRPSANVRYELDRVSRGDKVVVTTASHAWPSLEGNQVRYDRAPGVVEHYLAYDDGVEQLFSFAEIPAGDGDLVIRGRVETPLAGRVAATGEVRFETPGGPTVTFGKARACDGRGRIVDAGFVLAGGALEIRVPGDWLASAEGPLLVDPVIDAEFQLTNFVGDEERVAIAYSPTNNEFVVAYVSGGTNLAVSRLDAFGRVVDSGVVLDSTGSTKTRPAICWSEASVNRYLVAYRRATELWFTVIDGTLGNVVSPTRVYDPAGTTEDQDNPAIAYDASRDKWTVVWDDTSNSASRDVMVRQIGTGGLLGGTSVVRNVTNALSDPTIAYSSTSDRYLVGYVQAGNLFTGPRILGTILNGTVGILSSITVRLNSGALGPVAPSACWSASVNDFWVAYTAPGVTLTDIHANRVTTTGTVGSNITIVSNSDAETNAAITYLSTSQSLLVTYERTTSAQKNVWARELKGTGTAVAAEFQITQSLTDEAYPAVAANTGQGDWLMCWEDGRSGTDRDIWARRYSTETTTPTVLRFTPPHGSTGQLLDQRYAFVEFSHEMNSATINTTNIKLFQNGITPITTHSVFWIGGGTRWAMISLANDWPSAQPIKIQVTGSVQNSGGVSMGTTKEATFTTGTATTAADTDGDGLLDVEEIALGTLDWYNDYDGDGIDDFDEIYYTFTDPFSWDTDGDGIQDDVDSTPRGSAGDDPNVPAVPLSWTLSVTNVVPAGTFGSPATGVPASPRIVITFNNPVYDWSVDSYNVTLENQSTWTTEYLNVETQPNPNTIVVTPTSPLSAGTTYLLTVASGYGSVLDWNYNDVSVGATSYFTVASATTDSYEPPHYDETLAMTDWEKFPLLGPTASGRMGSAHVVPSTRKIVVTEVDVVTPGRGVDVGVVRVHRNNDDAASGMFGNNWHCAYDASFESVADENSDGYRELRHRTPDGRLFTYKSQSSATASTYQSPIGFYDTLKVLTVSGNELLVQRTKHGVEYFYEFHQSGNTTVEDPDALPLGAVGRLVRIRDANQNLVVINRAAANHATRPNRIESIVDDLDRTTTFTYSVTSGQEDLCVEVSQFSGASTTRSWLYTYDGSRSLVKVETPPSDFSDEGTPVSSTRKDREYAYSLSGGVYSLSSIEDGRDNVSFRVFYDDNRDVRQVDYGAGADAGTALYSFRRVSGVNEATQLDRNGNVLVLEHVDTAAAPFWTISSQRVYTRGLHPNAPGGEPTSYVTTYTHDDDSEVVEVENANLVRLIRDSKGNVLQLIRKAATPAELSTYGASYKREEDIVVDCAYEPKFNRLIRLTEPRGNNAEFVGTTSSIVSTTESVASQTARTFDAANVDEVKRNAYTKFFYYDHENIGTRLSADTTAIGDTVSLVRQVPQSYGRTAANATRDPPDSAFNDADSDGFPDRGGNLYVIRDGRPYAVDRTTGLLGGSRQVIEHAYTYNQWGQRVFEILPDDNTHRSEYYVGSFNLSTNPNRGFLRRRVVDTEYRDGDMDLSEGDPSTSPSGTGMELTTTFTYDVFGNVLTMQNPRAVTWTREVNLLNLVTKTTTPSPFEYDTEYVYDGNNNLVEIQIENAVASDTDDDGIQESGEQVVVSGHAEFVHEFSYSSANMLVRQDLDAYGSTPSVATTTFSYDRKQLRIGMREHEGNTHVWRYDERDLVYETIEGANDTVFSETTKYDYDHNRNLVQILDDDGNTNPALSVTVDVFDRATRLTDELGNRIDTTYDVGGFPRQELVTGLPRGAPGDLPNTVLANTMCRFDEIGRPIQRARELFGTSATHATLGLTLNTGLFDESANRVASGELAYELICWGKCSCEKGFVDPFGRVCKVDHDGADRITSWTDFLGSQKIYGFDPANNPIRITEIEKSDDGLTTETYYTENFFDAQNRIIATTSHLGNTERLLYDSRNNVVQKSDAMGSMAGGLTIYSLDPLEEHLPFPQVSATTPAADTSVNGRGNTVRYTYDGLGRLLSTIRDMRSDGTGAGTILAGQEIVTSQAWDGNGRLISQTDPNDNVTGYAYDSQNRLILTLLADQVTRQRQLWSRVDTLISATDARGVVTTYTYDAAERRIGGTVSNLPYGQEQTTFFAWRYDGLGRMTQAEDNDTITELHYDSFSRQVRDLQHVSTGAARTSSAQSLASAVSGDMRRVYDASGNLIRQTYPSNTVFDRTYDEVNRLTAISDAGGTVATFEHIGMGARRLSRTYPTPSVTATYGYDAERKITRLDHFGGVSSQRIRGFTYAWDRAGNRRYERRLTVNSNASEVGGPGEFYKYDSAYRLVHEDRDVTSGNLDLVLHNKTSVTAPTPVTTASSDYLYDRAGNRQKTVIDTVTQLYELRMSNNEFDAAMNQYSRIGSALRTHDANGNLTSAGELPDQRFFDANDQFVQWTTATKDVRYRYDALGRRVSKRMLAGGTTHTLYFYDGWQCVEETTSAGVVERRYVFGEGIDEPVRATLKDVLDLDSDMSTTDMVDLYYHENSLGSVVALTTSSGAVVESYRYDAWGNAKVYNQAGSQVSATLVQQPFMFTGRRLDWEEGSGLYYYRLRYYDPAAGRFVSRDALGLWGDPSQRGNGQSYCGNNPVNRIDPLGLLTPVFRPSADGQGRDVFVRIDEGDTAGDLERLIHPHGPQPTGDDATASLTPGDEIPIGSVPIFKGFEDERYQKWDLLIAILVSEFNRRKKEAVDCTDEQLKGVPDLTTALVKAWMIQEAGGGDRGSRAAWDADPLQVNVPGDWDDVAKGPGGLGLTKPRNRNEGTIEGNLWAALRFLARKGFGRSGRPPSRRPGGFFDPREKHGDMTDWRDALRRYNGRQDPGRDGRPYSDGYADKILDRGMNPGKHVPIQFD